MAIKSLTTSTRNDPVPMPPYPVLCYAPGCRNEAAFKIAARWSDGVTGELKTYFLTCPTCLPELFPVVKVKQGACRLAPGESLGPPEVYELTRGQRDQALRRRIDLEKAVEGDP